MREAIKKWWEGEYVLHKDDAYSAVVFIGGIDKRHWTANLARWALAFYLREWKWVWGVVGTVIGALLFKKY